MHPRRLRVAHSATKPSPRSCNILQSSHRKPKSMLPPVTQHSYRREQLRDSGIDSRKSLSNLVRLPKRTSLAKVQGVGPLTHNSGPPQVQAQEAWRAERHLQLQMQGLLVILNHVESYLYSASRLMDAGHYSLATKVKFLLPETPTSHV